MTKMILRLSALSVILVAFGAYAQEVVSTTTSTIPPSAQLPDDPIGKIEGIWGFFQSGMILSAIAGILGLLLLLLNAGPLKDRFGPNGKQDWVRPLISVLVAGLGAAEVANLAGADVAAMIGASVTAALGSGALQRLVQEILD